LNSASQVDALYPERPFLTLSTAVFKSFLTVLKHNPLGMSVNPTLSQFGNNFG